MILRIALLVSLWLTVPLPAMAQDGPVRLHAPEALQDTGLLRYILPRFSLKTQVRVTLTEPDAAQIRLGETGRPLFSGLGTVWHMEVTETDHPGVLRLADWLRSDIGKDTIYAFAPDGTAPFGPPPQVEVEVVELEFSGDAALGHRVSLEKCTRCHVVDEATRMAGIGSTPSFAVLRSLPDWDGRFAAFYALKPHPAFTQVDDITEPFSAQRPSPIAPISLSLDELEAILAYVSTIDAADLGNPLQFQ